MITKGKHPTSLDSRSSSTVDAQHRGSPKEIALPPTLTVKQLGDLINVSPVEIIKQLMRNGVMAAINQVIDFDLAAAVTPAFGIKSKREQHAQRAPSHTQQALEQTNENNRMPRNPVTTILGHVDHGKTTLLDTIRDSHITDAEVGGITQRIGAYQVDYKDQKITFLDTPGHEAFTTLRARGAQATDIAILVVAADDGVMPQTIEAINHAKAAQIPMVVAINKIDKPDANPDTVKRQLSEHDILVEEWGGDVIAVPISAKNKLGIDDLLDTILVVAEVAELTANFDGPANGVIIEAELDRSKGSLATILVQNGTLKVGDNVVAGSAWGRLKAMNTSVGMRIKEAGPSIPVEVLGFNSLPRAGDIFFVTPDDKAARTIAERNLVKKEEDQTLARALTLEDVMSSITTGEAKALNLLLKADVQGSLEAVQESLKRLDQSNVAKINVLHSGSGAISDSDVLLAVASNAIILGFNTTVEPSAEKASERERVEIRLYNIIYNLIEDVEKALQGILEPTYKEVVQGRAEIRAVFKAGKQGKIAGCMVADGKLTRGTAMRVIRNGDTVFEGTIISLRRFKEDVNEVIQGYECGVGITGFEDLQEGDTIESHRRERVPN